MMEQKCFVASLQLIGSYNKKCQYMFMIRRAKIHTYLN